MKRKFALTMCMFLVLCAAVLVYPQTTTEQVAYYTTDFNGASDFTPKSFSVSFAERTSHTKALALQAPDYVVSGVTCVPIAGANLLGFYDRFYTEIIPNFTPGVVYAGSYYVYNAYDENVTNATLQLAADMGLTSPATQGATVDQFKSGFTKYIKRKSLSVGYTSVMQGSSLSYEALKTQINAGKPIIIFCSKFNLVRMNETDTVDYVTLSVCDDPHAMAVFGYTEYTYTFDNGSSRIDKYLEVASGLLEKRFAMVYLGSDIKVDNAYAISIS